MTVLAEPRQDPRVRRTRGLLQGALLALARERPLEEISVGDIAQRATVSRATFYLHYRDRDALLADTVSTIVRTDASAAAQTELPPVLDERTPTPQYIVDFFADLEANAPLFRQLLGAEGSALVMTRMREELQTAVHGLIATMTDAGRRVVPDGVHAAYLAGALLSVVTHWLHEEPRVSARRIATDVWRLAIQPVARR